MSAVFNENRMRGCDQRCIILVRVTRIERNAVDETVRFDGVLIHRPFVPQFVCSSRVGLRKVAEIEKELSN